MRKATNGFTIVELLIVIIVIAILATISVVAYNGIQNKAHDTTIQSDLRSDYSAIMRFRAINDSYPVSQSEINSVFVASRKSYGGGSNTLIYCYSDTAMAIVARSVSGNGFYYSSVSGANKLSVWPGDGNANLCPAAGIPITSSGYTATWLAVNGAWVSWFTPGA